ncbi:RNA 2'-phosphotransferase [Massilia sp. Leaf139]|uniref:RNA 2'-phosphotransferase n=1 Tax=Massilia sp. Leaf139 TaxID=1736272 RepID=UPI0006F4C795|nr:RNA 2'-phosphotransferase [Massilia sp. Leaf139]KQQ89061.1 RNA 2'-phosphotransferase [Massilia sp. Leaf139]
MNKRIVETSKFLSFVLRHQPQAIGIDLDREGWTDIAALLVAANEDGRRLDRALIDEVVQTNDKGRFAISGDGLRIRALQGHSSAGVQLTHRALAPPPVLYHGTATRFVAAIERQGLRAGSRHHVHLSQEQATAASVGARYGMPVVLRIDAAAMAADGFVFYLADNGVWLTEAVPPRYLSRSTGAGVGAT